MRYTARPSRTPPTIRPMPTNSCSRPSTAPCSSAVALVTPSGAVGGVALDVARPEPCRGERPAGAARRPWCGSWRSASSTVPTWSRQGSIERPRPRGGCSPPGRGAVWSGTPYQRGGTRASIPTGRRISRRDRPTGRRRRVRTTSVSRRRRTARGPRIARRRRGRRRWRTARRRCPGSSPVTPSRIVAGSNLTASAENVLPRRGSPRPARPARRRRTGRDSPSVAPSVATNS